MGSFIKIETCNTAVRQKVNEKRQSDGSHFPFFVVFDKYPPVCEAKLYSEHKPRSICPVIGLTFTQVANRFAALLF